jgi:hypothetical protein
VPLNLAKSQGKPGRLRRRAGLAAVCHSLARPLLYPTSQDGFYRPAKSSNYLGGPGRVGRPRVAGGNIVIPGQIARAVVRVLVSMAGGALLGVVYAAVVGTVHIGAYGRWAGLPAFAVGCGLIGVVLGLLKCLVWAVSGKAVREIAGGGSPPVSNRPPGPARRTADDAGRGCDRSPVCPGGRAAGGGLAARPCSWSGLWRSYTSPN